MYIYFKMIAGVGNDSYIYYWKSKGLPDEKTIKTLSKHLIIALLQIYVIMVLKQEQNSMEAVWNKMKLHLIMEK